MYYENDYIMRLIREMIRAIIKLIFHIDTENPLEALAKDEKSQQVLDRLLNRIDEGKINEAENELFDMTCDGSRTNLETALLFYTYLNEKEDDFLRAHDYSREEIRLGLEDLIGRYGISGLGDIFADAP